MEPVRIKPVCDASHRPVRSVSEATVQMQTPHLELRWGVWLCSTLAMTYFLTGNPQYHRRGVVSRSCSGWEGVGPTRYGRQEFWNGKVELDCVLHRAVCTDAQGYRVKPHGQLVSISSRHYCPYTPDLSTSWSRTTLQGDQVPGRSHLQASFPLRCFQRLSLPHIATRRCHWRDNRYTRDASTPVLSY